MTADTYMEWIGTGSGLNPVLGNTSFLMKGAERTLLVDCGFTVPIELMKSDQLKDVTDIIITHTHADHMGGLEALGFMHYFAWKKRGDTRINLYVGTDAFAQDLWEHSLRGGMEKIVSDDNEPQNATLETYFKIHTGAQVRIPGLPQASLFPTLHVPGLENYGVEFDNGIWYSGDTVELPKREPRIIFQDCQFFESKSDVHISYDKLWRVLPADVRAKMHLVHLGHGWDKKDALADGFAGFVKPTDRYEL